jgi:hypothetical protein
MSAARVDLRASAIDRARAVAEFSCPVAEIDRALVAAESSCQRVEIGRAVAELVHRLGPAAESAAWAE